MIEDLLPKGEYEGLFADNKSNKIYVLCKKCNKEKNKKRGVGFMIDMSVSELKAQKFEIMLSNIEDLAEGFEPSALALNPISQDWYILSSVNQLLVVADHNWQVKTTKELERSEFKQPEGIAFDGKGNLYISNEGAGNAVANILKFKRVER